MIEKNKEKTQELINYLNAKINKIIKLLRKGYDTKKIKEDRKLKLRQKEVIFLNKKIVISKDDIISLAKARIKAKRGNKGLQKLFVFYEELPFACNENIAKTRAKLLKNFLINKEFADLSCGFGIQSLYFLKYSKKAIFFEIDIKKLLFAYLNSFILGLNEKISFLNRDSTKLEEEIIDKLKKLDFIYSDPGRPLNQKRDFNSLSPNPLILKKYNLNYLFDLPPQMDKNLIMRELGNICLEYIEFEGEINRLLVYSPKLKIAMNLKSRKAIINENFIIEGEPKEQKILEYKGEKYLIEPFPSLIYADLLDYGIIKQKRRIFIPTEEINEELEKIAKNKYLVIDKVNSLENLRELNKKKIKEIFKDNLINLILRINISDKEYYKLKKELEEKINEKNQNREKKTFYIIEVPCENKKTYLICEKV